MVAIPGIDHSSKNPGAAKIKAAGFEFVARYVSPNTPAHPNKRLTLDEVNDCRSNHLNVVAIWETTADRALGGFNFGFDDAKAANDYCKSIGLPEGRPIYFCAQDAPFTTAQDNQVIRYFQGIFSYFRDTRLIGSYAGYFVTKKLFDNQLIKYAWQTPSWSKIQGIIQYDHRVQIHQFTSPMHKGSTISIGGVDCDLDTAVAEDYGQWWYTPKPPQEDQLASADVQKLLDRLETLENKIDNVYEVMRSRVPDGKGGYVFDSAHEFMSVSAANKRLSTIETNLEQLLNSTTLQK